MAEDQIERLLQIVNTLCNRRRTTVSELVGEYGVSPKTIRRDLDRLSVIFPVIERREGRKKYWSLPDGFKRIPPIVFTPSELYVLREATRFLKGLGDPFLRPSLATITHKIRASFDDERCESFENLRRTLSVSFSGKKDYRDEKGFLHQLLIAAGEQRRIRILYRGLKDQEPKPRKVDPYRLWYRDGAVYLVGFCHLRRKVRMFAVDRISLLELTKENFLIPESFDFNEYTQNAFSVMIEDPVTVRVRFAPEFARYIEEREWHPSQEFKQGPDGSLFLKLTVGGTQEIKRWILSFGPAAEVLDPPELIEEIRSDLEKMRARYMPGQEQKGRETG